MERIGELGSEILFDQLVSPLFPFFIQAGGLLEVFIGVREDGSVSWYICESVSGIVCFHDVFSF